MKKNEHSIFGDIPTGGRFGKYHSAILTTFSFDLLHFDNQLLNLLRRKQICNINIFADEHQFDNSLEYVSPLYVSNIGRDYTVTTFNVKGAFHPKINFFVGDESVMMIVGSGNLTASGHGKNHEIFAGFIIDDEDDNARPLIEECWRYLKTLSGKSGSFVNGLVQQVIPENCKFLDEDYAINPHKFCKVNDIYEAALLYPDNTSILHQLTEIVNAKDVSQITVVSPFFDEDGETLESLAGIFKNATVDVLIQGDCSLPPNKMQQNSRISFYDFDATTRGEQTLGSNYARQLHAKIIHLKTDKAEYCLLGSANATVAGLGRLDKPGINEEFCVLYRSESKDFLKHLGLGKRKKLQTKIAELKRETNETKTQSEKKPYHIVSAYCVNTTLTVIADSNVSLDSCILIDDGDRISFETPERISSNTIILSVAKTKKSLVCCICDKDGQQLSNRVFVHWTDKLETTNPSQTSRNLNRLISQLESSGFDGLEVTDILSDIMYDVLSENEGKVKIIHSSSSEKYKGHSFLPDVKYNPEYDNDITNQSKAINNFDSTSRLIECIEESIKRKIRMIDDEMKYEEEEEDASASSNERVAKQDEDAIAVDISGITDYAYQAEHLLDKYISLVKRRIEMCKKGGSNCLTKDDLNFFSISLFTSSEICYLNRMRYSVEKTSYLKQLYDSFDRCMNVMGLEALCVFSDLCKRSFCPKNVDDDYRRIVDRSMKYALLYAALFSKYATVEVRNIFDKRIIGAIQSMKDTFNGIPSMEYLEKEYSPLMERYDYCFRMTHIENIINKLT